MYATMCNCLLLFYYHAGDINVMLAENDYVQAVTQIQPIAGKSFNEMGLAHYCFTVCLGYCETNWVLQDLNLEVQIEATFWAICCLWSSKLKEFRYLTTPQFFSFVVKDLSNFAINKDFVLLLEILSNFYKLQGVYIFFECVLVPENNFFD